MHVCVWVVWYLPCCAIFKFIIYRTAPFKKTSEPITRQFHSTSILWVCPWVYQAATPRTKYMIWQTLPAVASCINICMLVQVCQSCHQRQILRESTHCLGGIWGHETNFQFQSMPLLRKSSFVSFFVLARVHPLHGKQVQLEPMVSGLFFVCA